MSEKPLIIQKHQDWRQGKKPLRVFKICPTLRSNMGDTEPLVAIPIKKHQYGKHQQDCVYDPSGLAPTVAPGTHGSGPHLLKIMVPAALKEQRTPEAKQIRKQIRKNGGKDWSPRRGKELAPRTDGLANTLTTMEQDPNKLILVIDPYNNVIPKDQQNATSLRTNFANGNTWVGERKEDK